MGAHGGVIDGQTNCPDCRDDPDCVGQYPRPTGIAVGYTNAVYNKHTTRGSDFHYVLGELHSNPLWIHNLRLTNLPLKL